jgi:hypothetical protein
LGEALEAQGQEIPPELAQDPRLQQVVGVENQVKDMDMDIILTEAPDTVNIQAEQFELLLNFAAQRPDAIPVEMLLEMSSLRGKDAIIERLTGQSPEAQEQFQAQQAKQARAEQLLAAEKVSEINKNEASAAQSRATAAEKVAGIDEARARLIIDAMEERRQTQEEQRENILEFRNA